MYFIRDLVGNLYSPQFSVKGGTRNIRIFGHTLYICDRIWEIGLITSWVKIEFLPEKAPTKFKYCMRKLGVLLIASF